MITINLSDEQARKLLAATGWNDPIQNDLAREIFIQLENKLTPPSNEQAAIAAWRAENGHTAEVIENWKRKHETMEGFE